MYDLEISMNNRTNRQLMEERIKFLRIRHAQKHGLKDRIRSLLLGGTVMHERRTCITYNAESFNENNSILFTGQCLLKKDENLECPVTLQDAIECEVLRDLLEKHPMPAVCMYPDSIYREFMKGFSENDVDEKNVEIATDKYMRFRRIMLPGVQHIRISDFNGKFTGEIFGEERERLSGEVRRIYGGRLLPESQTHSLQKVLLDYGFKTIILPSIIGYGNRNIVIFAEPAEICSVYAAEIAGRALGKDIKIGLLGNLPVPSLEFLIDRKIDMYSANRNARIYLNESDSEVRKKLDAEPDFCAVSVYLSPLTTTDQLTDARKSRKKEEIAEILMEQIKVFRRYVE